MKEWNMMQIKHTCKEKKKWNHSYQLHIHQQVLASISISYWPSYVQAVSFKHLFCTLLFHYFHNLRIDYYHYLNAYNEILFNAVCLQMLTVTTINERKRKDMPFAVVDEEVMSRLLLWFNRWTNLYVKEEKKKACMKEQRNMRLPWGDLQRLPLDKCQNRINTTI